MRETVRPVVKDILDEIEIVSADAVEGLVLSDTYRTDGKSYGGVEIGYLGNFFQSLMVGVTEPVNMPARELRFTRIKKYKYGVSTEQIVNAVRLERRFASYAEAAAEMAIMLRKQPKGEDGKIQASKKRTFYVFIDGVVYCRWYSHHKYWGVGAEPYTSPRVWCLDHMVVSR